LIPDLFPRAAGARAAQFVALSIADGNQFYILKPFENPNMSPATSTAAEDSDSQF